MKQSAPEVGTQRWFEETHDRIIFETRAFDDFLQACRCLSELKQARPSEGAITGTALFQYSLISYCKPFNSYGRNKYPLSELRKFSGFDESIHEQIFLFRNKIFAHSDAISALAIIKSEPTSDGVRDGLKFWSEIYSFDSIKMDDDTIDKFLAHFNASYKHCLKIVTDTISIYSKAHLAFPENSSILEINRASASVQKFDMINEDDHRYRVVSTPEISVFKKSL